MTSTDTAGSVPAPSAMSGFERYLTVWVLLCIAAEVAPIHAEARLIIVALFGRQFVRDAHCRCEQKGGEGNSGNDACHIVASLLIWG